MTVSPYCPGPQPDPTRGCPPRREFTLYADMAFVTYCRSRLDDKEQFFRCLQQSVQRSLHAFKDTEQVTVQIYGSKELHEDGVTPHYHVLLRFSKKIYWSKARQRLFVWVDVRGRREVDTTSIFIRKKPAKETDSQFLWSVQRYIGKRGDVFGQMIPLPCMKTTGGVGTTPDMRHGNSFK